MKRMTWVPPALIILVLSSGPVRAQTYGQQKIRFMMQVDGYADGSSSVSCYMINPETRMPIPMKRASDNLSEETAAAFQSAVITRSWHWDWPTTIGFKFTNDSKPHKNKVKKIQNTQINQRRGNNNVPTMRVTNQIVAVKPISQFHNPNLYYIQLDFDEKNTVVMTSDDQFFKDIFGNLVEPDRVSLTKIFATLYYAQQGSRLIGLHRIEETDIYLRMDYFSRSKDIYTRLGLVALRFCLGYQATVWTHDYMSPNNHHATPQAIQTINSDTWQKISFVRDDFYYQDKLTIASPAFLEIPRMLPFENEVLDIGDYTLPYVENDEIILGKTSILFLTNLKAFGGAKKAVVKIYRITDDNPPKQKRIVTLSGNTLYYPQNTSYGEVYPAIFLNHIRLGRQVELNKLKNAVKNFGKAQTIDGVHFEKALPIKVKIFGYLTENGAKKKLVRNFWLVNQGKKQD